MQEIVQNNTSISENIKSVLNSKLSSAISLGNSVDFSEVFASASKKQAELMDTTGNNTKKVQTTSNTDSVKTTDTLTQEKQTTNKKIKNKTQDKKNNNDTKENKEDTKINNEDKIDTKAQINADTEETATNILLNTQTNENNVIENFENNTNTQMQFSLNATQIEINTDVENTDATSETTQEDNTVENISINKSDNTVKDILDKNTENLDNNTSVADINLKNTKTEKSSIFVEENNVHIDSSLKDINISNATEINMQNVIENEILEELNLSVENVSITQTPQTATFIQDAGEQLIQMSIEKSGTGKIQGLSAMNNMQNSNSALQNQNNQNNAMNFQDAQKNFQTKLSDLKATDKNAKFAEIQKNDILNQIGAKFEQLKDGVTSKITLALRPENLGRVVIEMSQDKNGVTTNILAQNQDVKEILEKNVDILKDQLTKAGVSVDNISIKAPESNENSNFLANGNSKENFNHQEQNFSDNSKEKHFGNKENKQENSKIEFSEIAQDSSSVQDESYQGIKVGKNVYNI